MEIVKTINSLRSRLSQDRTVGFAPTMGALHEGHLALVRRSVRENDQTVCSIFVNPTQFNDPADLRRYPRTPAKDAELLQKVGCDLVFLPGETEIYPPEGLEVPPMEFGALNRVLEGTHRPGHFDGVARVVWRLLDIVQPQRLYMGQKDYQQFLVVRHMIRQLGLAVELVRCPTVREPDGLAMSSRNQRLTPEERQRALALHRALLQAEEQLDQKPVREIEAAALQYLVEAGLRPDYFAIVDGHNLAPVQRPAQHSIIVACVAAWAGNVRLIDNRMLREDVSSM